MKERKKKIQKLLNIVSKLQQAGPAPCEADALTITPQMDPSVKVFSKN